MSNLQSKRAEAPLPSQDLEVKPEILKSQVTVLSQTSEAKLQQDEKSLEIPVEADLKPATEADKKRLPAEDAKTDANSQKENVAEDDDKEASPQVIAEEAKPTEVVSQDEEKPSTHEKMTAEAKEQEVATEQKPEDDQKVEVAEVEEVATKTDLDKKDDQVAEPDLKSKKRSHDQITNLEEEAKPEGEEVEQPKATDSQPDGVKKLKVEIESLEKDIKEASQAEQPKAEEAKVVECDADKEDETAQDGHKEEEPIKDTAQEAKEDAAVAKENPVEVSATKEAQSIFNVQPLFQTQTKEKSDAAAENQAKDAQDEKIGGEVNATPCFNPETVVTTLSKEKTVSTDIEAMYLQEINKVSDKQEDAKEAAVASKPAESQ